MIEEQFLNAVDIGPDDLVLPTDYFYSYTARISEEYTSDVVQVVLDHAYNLLPVICMGKYTDISTEIWNFMPGNRSKLFFKS